MTGASGGAHILWAEDMEGDRRLIQLALQSIGAKARIQFVPDGKALLQAIQGHAPDLVVLDLNMPGMDGKETLQRLRHAPEGGNLAAVVFTSSNNVDEHAACRQLGAGAVINKPPNFDDFVLAIATIVERASSAPVPA
jgi:CheY-like chemotaxis protein